MQTNKTFTHKLIVQQQQRKKNKIEWRNKTKYAPKVVVPTKSWNSAKKKTLSNQRNVCIFNQTINIKTFAYCRS